MDKVFIERLWRSRKHSFWEEGQLRAKSASYYDQSFGGDENRRS